MQKYFVADEYLLSSPPLMKGDWSEMYPASEVDAKIDGYQKLTAECGDVIRDRNARIAQMQIEISAVTKQRDETYAKLVEARERIQRLTFGKN